VEKTLVDEVVDWLTGKGNYDHDEYVAQPPETQVAMIQTRKSFRHSYMIFCARAIKTLNHDDRVSGNSL
jgi:hypothetical protein